MNRQFLLRLWISMSLLWLLCAPFVLEGVYFPLEKTTRVPVDRELRFADQEAIADAMGCEDSPGDLEVVEDPANEGSYWGGQQSPRQSYFAQGTCLRSFDLEKANEKWLRTLIPPIGLALLMILACWVRASWEPKTQRGIEEEQSLGHPSSSIREEHATHQKDESASQHGTAKKRQSGLVRLIAGDLPLWKTFWLFYFPASMVLGAAAKVTMVPALLVAISAVGLVPIVSTWRSAGRSDEIWKILTRAFLCIVITVQIVGVLSLFSG